MDVFLSPIKKLNLHHNFISTPSMVNSSSLSSSSSSSTSSITPTSYLASPLASYSPQTLIHSVPISPSTPIPLSMSPSPLIKLDSTQQDPDYFFNLEQNEGISDFYSSFDNNSMTLSEITTTTSSSS